MATVVVATVTVGYCGVLAPSFRLHCFSTKPNMENKNQLVTTRMPRHRMREQYTFLSFPQ